MSHGPTGDFAPQSGRFAGVQAPPRSELVLSGKVRRGHLAQEPFFNRLSIIDGSPCGMRSSAPNFLSIVKLAAVRCVHDLI
jgi:hypothetical protein